uniref:Uncharacterized protein n=1 Tax=Grammatophora oceanica TaxID=210454 RepID=A0A7S1VS74_9STRA|mmetsp:Transcript_5932/g.8425  ORF Transcript_5932/g.8425 Transcript_5932/m.8425 type:complete len:201 (+) Transcript_5932:106-708(+)
MTKSFFGAAIALFFLASVPPMQGQFEQPPLPVCFQFDTVDLVGSFESYDLAGDSFGTPGDLSMSTSLAIDGSVTEGRYEISELSVQAVCTILPQNDGAPTAPMCFIEADMTFCVKRRRDGDEGCSIDFSGRFMATGTGPRAYTITGGMDDFFGAFGTFNPVFPSDPVDLPVTLPTDIHLCFHGEPTGEGGGRGGDSGRDN